MQRSRRYFVRSVAITLAVVPIFAGLWLLSGSAHAAGTSCSSSHASELPGVLGFKKESLDKLPGGWFGGPKGTISLLSKAEHEGQKVVRIERDSRSSSQFSSLTNCIKMDFTGKAITLQGFLRIKKVKGFAGLWIREDGYEQVLAFDNMGAKHLHGTSGWKEYSVTLPIKPKAVNLYFGVLLSGTGQAWASGLKLLADGKPVWQAPHRKIPPTPDIPFYTDHQFDHGSGITINKLTKIQIANLATLGKVWGFLKYYDPTVTSGKRQWDYDLLRIMPAILKAKNRKSAEAALVHWIKKLGPVSRCKPCVHLNPKNLQLRPPLKWIHDSKRLGKALSDQLQNIYRNRSAGSQFYVSLVPKVRNPVFKHELPYSSVKFPDSGFQLLALYRYWNIIEYWYPDRNIIGENWNKVLAEFIPRLATANSRKGYELQLMALIAKVHDSHANLRGSAVRPPVGKCHLPVRIRYVQKQPIVTAYEDGKNASTSPFKIGDVIVELDAKLVAKLFEEWAPYYGASNTAALHRNLSSSMTRGPCGDTTVGIRRGSHVIHVKAKRVPIAKMDLFGTDDLPGPTFRLLSPQVAYLKLSSVKADQVANDIKRAAGTKGLIIDIRNYPSQFVVFALGSLLVNQKTPFARFTYGDLSTPGAFHWTPSISLKPRQPHYKGKIVILVNAVTQSQAEYTAMAFRAAPRAIVVGSTTAGADGNVSKITLPGGIHTMISGLGVFYPDKKPAQRVGIVPDVVVKPTIADIRDGDDPVLDKAIRLIVGPKVPESKIRKMYQTQPKQSSKH